MSKFASPVGHGQDSAEYRVDKIAKREREREREREILTEYRADKIAKRERDRKWEERQKYGFFLSKFVSSLCVQCMGRSAQT